MSRTILLQPECYVYTQFLSRVFTLMQDRISILYAMGKSTPITLGPFTFFSKKAVRDELRALRDAYIDGRPILQADAVELLLAVVAAHPQASEKIGSGVTGFFVARAPHHPTYCFYLSRIDGSRTDFSWNEMLTPTDPSTRLRMACRNAIQDQKAAFREQGWSAEDHTPRTCPITGKQFVRSQAHVDHTPPATLKTLVDTWLGTEGLTIQDIPVIHTGDLRSQDDFADGKHFASWRSFHARNATLRIVSAEGNLIQGSRQLYM